MQTETTLNRTPEQMAHIRAQDVFAEIIIASNDPLAIDIWQMKRSIFRFTDGQNTEAAFLQDFLRVGMNELCILPHLKYKERPIKFGSTLNEVLDAISQTPVAEHSFEKLLNQNSFGIASKIIAALKEGRINSGTQFIVFIYKKYS